MKFVSLRKVAMATMLSMTLATVAMPAVAEAATSASISVSSTTLPAAGGLVTLKYSMGTGISKCSLVQTISGTGSVSTTLPCQPKAQTQSLGPFALPASTKSSPTVWVFTLTLFSSKAPVKVAALVTEAAVAHSTYVALGDSFSSGEGNKASGWVNFNGVADNSLTANDKCDRSSKAYPQLVNTGLSAVSGVSLPKMTFSFIACSGATSSDLDPQSPASGLGLAGATGDYGENAQLLDAAELHNARIVTLTAGGDDVNFGAVATACYAASSGCLPISSVLDLEKNIANLKETLETLYADVRAAAPNAAIYVVGYPALLPPPDQITPYELLRGCSGINGLALNYLATAQKNIATAISQAANAAGVYFVDPNSGSNSFLTDPAHLNSLEKGSGHTLCSPSSRWSNAVEANSTFSFHPNESGQAALARSVLAKIQSTHAAVSAPPTPTNLTTKSIVSNGNSYCALLTSGGVDCWGYGQNGELGNGQNNDSAIPVAVVSTSGSGTLSGVASLTGTSYGYCALLTSGGVDCWGSGGYGRLGNGQFYTSGPYGSAIPVAVVSTSGSGTLSGVASLTSNGDGNAYGSSYCALLTSGGVDCWGYGPNGQLGNGQNNDSAIPVAVVSTSGSGTLSGVASLTSDYKGSSYCALLTSGGVDCWGLGYQGQLGNGKFYTSGNYGSAIPVAVVSTSGSGTLSGVASLTSDYNGYCALLTSGGVDCWGYGSYGELGNGQFNNSAIPVAVVSTSGSGTLSGVASLTSDYNGYCALLTSGGVDCWGYGYSGELGNGQNNDSAIPVAVVSTSGSGSLSGVASLTSTSYGYGGGYCALLTSGGVDCWGFGYQGRLGNGQFYTYDEPGNRGSAIPVAVVSTSGSGTLSGVASLTSDYYGYCALLTSGGVDCWGSGYYGRLGNGQFYPSGNLGSAIPVAVVSTSGSGTLSGVKLH